MEEQPIVTKVDFAISLLKGIGAPVNAANVSALLSWMNAEGGNWNNTATYNPLNTTQPYNGSTVMSGGNSAGVQAYGSWSDGVAATLKTLTNGNYSSIVAALRNSAGCGSVAGAVASSPWGTGAFSCNQSVNDAQVAQAVSDPGANITASVGGSSATQASSLNANPGDLFGIPGAVGTGIGAALNPIYNDFKKFALIGLGIAAGGALVVSGILISAKKPIGDAARVASNAAMVAA